MPTLSAAALVELAADILRSGGSSAEEALEVAHNLVEANLQGHDSHGVGMIPRYMASIAEGGLTPNASAERIADNGVALVYDGHCGYGQVVTRQVMAAGIERALERGVCITSLRNAHHLGRVGAWAEQCANAGLVSIHFANVFCPPLVAPFNGTRAKFGTNPFCVGVPGADQAHLILDFATSAIAVGKVRVALNKGERLKPGEVIDADGRPTTDPATMFGSPQGSLLPFGMHKGGGMALICAILGGALTGGKTERAARPGGALLVNNMLSIIVSPAVLGGAETFAAEVASYLPWVRDARPSEGDILLPGDIERRRKAERSVAGIDIDETTWAQLREAKAAL